MREAPSYPKKPILERKEFEKSTASDPLHSSSLLPIIVVMKIWLRIGAEQCGEQARRQHCSVNLASPRPPLPSRTLPAGKRASRSLRRGAARRRSAAVDCAPRTVADQGHPLANSRSVPAVALRPFRVPPTGPRTAPATKKLLKTERFFRSGHTISNRFWCENRSCRKQTIKPCLTGARMHIRHFGFLALFANRFHASNRRSRLKTERFFQSCWTTSNRNWPTNRSSRKQTIKPFLTETRIARCDFGFLALFNAVRNREQRQFSATDVRQSLGRRVLLLPGEIATNELHRTHPE
jgi:hypothetical protein